MIWSWTRFCQTWNVVLIDQINAIVQYNFNWKLNYQPHLMQIKCFRITWILFQLQNLVLISSDGEITFYLRQMWFQSTKRSAETGLEKISKNRSTE